MPPNGTEPPNGIADGDDSHSAANTFLYSKGPVTKVADKAMRLKAVLTDPMVAANKKLAGKTKPHLRALLDNPRWGLMMICLLFLDVLCVIAELLIEVNVVCKIVEDDYDKLEKEKDYADNHSDSPYGDDKEAPHRRSRNLLFHVVHQLSDPMVMHHLSGASAMEALFGQTTPAALPGADFDIYSGGRHLLAGAGHDIPEAVHDAEITLKRLSLAILFIFLLESFFQVYVLGILEWFSQKMLVLDFVVVVVSILLELVFSAKGGNLLVFIRVWRFLRLSHGIFSGTSELNAMKEANSLAAVQLEDLQKELNAFSVRDDEKTTIIENMEKEIAELRVQSGIKSTKPNLRFVTKAKLNPHGRVSDGGDAENGVSDGEVDFLDFDIEKKSG
mmetsp:Transcript_67511/g.213669  ORF Transcript_67511/g.213669 Transcript_67511/m.213669 type:complete len:388 (+) Transcript_67511:95-1258(+)